MHRWHITFTAPRAAGRRPRGMPILLMLMAGLCALPSAQAQDDTIFANGFERTAISPDPGVIGSDSHVAVSSGGRVYMVYSGATDSNDRNGPVRYGECGSGCMNPAHWHFLTLGHYGSSVLGGGARLALTAAGHPRVWWYEQSTVGGTGTFHYARCDTVCTTAAGWTVGSILSLNSGNQAYAPDDSPFALDSGDHPHYFYQEFGLVVYASCVSGCTSAGNWSYVGFNSQTIGTSSLVLRFAGLYPRILGDAPGAILNGGGNYITYGGCCNANDQWVNAPIVQASSNADDAIPLDLALTAQGLPRAAFYLVDQGAGGIYRLVYGACDDNCGPSGWVWVYPGLPQSAGFAGLGLELDAQNHPHIAWAGDPDLSGIYSQSVNLANCTSNCASPSGIWSSQAIETSASIPVPIPPLSGADALCVAGSQWKVGAEPSLALDSGGHAHLSWDIAFLETCPDTQGGYFTFPVPGPIRYAER